MLLFFKLKLRNFILKNGEEKGFQIFSWTKKAIILCIFIIDFVFLIKHHFWGSFPTDNLRYFTISVLYSIIYLLIANLLFFMAAEFFVLMPLNNILSDAVPEYYAEKHSSNARSTKQKNLKIKNIKY